MPTARRDSRFSTPAARRAARGRDGALAPTDDSLRGEPLGLPPRGCGGVNPQKGSECA